MTMTTQKKSRPGVAAPSQHNEALNNEQKDSTTPDRMSIRTRVKSLIVRAALFGLLSVRMADFLVQRGGLVND